MGCGFGAGTSCGASGSGLGSCPGRGSFGGYWVMPRKLHGTCPTRLCSNDVRCITVA